MRYLPLTEKEKKEILELCGVSSFEELTQQVPDNLRLKRLLNIPSALSELELLDHNLKLAEKNQAAQMISFQGQGAYDHYWPSVIDHLVSRGEFLTAYTPYQPELAQGTLQHIFEFQSMICELFDMEVANASLYDGSTACVEAVLMAARLENKSQGDIWVSEGTYDRTLKILHTYLDPLGYKIKIWPANSQSLTCRQSDLNDVSQPIAIVMQSPNKWGLIEDWQELKKASNHLKARSIAHVAHPHSLALYQAPGEANIDIVSGEGQAFGIPVGFGGPYLGLFATKKEYVRQMPGRLVGQTVDQKGRRAFCVTLSTREQHIRRSKATSNICSNQNLMALRAGIYLTLMGERGLKQVAQLSQSKATYVHQQLSQRNYTLANGDFFNEITVFFANHQELIHFQQTAERAGFIAGVPTQAPKHMSQHFALSLAFTERHNKKDLDRFINTVGAHS